MANRYTTDAELVARFPTLETVDVALRAASLSDAITFIDLEMYGEKASIAHIYLTAHFLAVDPESGFSGGGAAVTSRSMGSISASYAVPTYDVSDAALSETAYGRRYKAIRDSLFDPCMGLIGDAS